MKETKCNICGKEESLKGHDGKYYCYDCYEENFWYCEGCHKYHSFDSFCCYEFNGKLICHKFMEENNIHVCTECGSLFNSSNGIQHGRNWYCNDCASWINVEDTAQTEIDEIVFRHNYKPEPIFMGCSTNQATLGKKRVFGFESELLSNTKTVVSLIEKFSDIIYLKEDGSIETSSKDMGGFEVVSHPATLEYLKENKKFKNLFNFIHKNCDSNRSTGIHVHVNKSSLSNIMIIKLIYLFSNNSVYDILRKVAQRNFNTNHYCGNFSNCEVNSLTKELEKRKSAKQQNRYSVINLMPAKTVEFRMFAGNSDKFAVITACEFIELTIKFIEGETIINLRRNDINIKYKNFLLKYGSKDLIKRIK